MRVTKQAAIVLLTFSLGAGARAQVLAPREIRDPQIRALQEKYQSELKLIAQAAAMHSFPYHFYFSRTLDLAEKDQAGTDQRAIQFDRHGNQVVLKITGNYFASYSTTLMTAEERARQTYEDVIQPLLQSTTPALLRENQLQAFAFEISHHVRRKVLGVPSEGVENVVLILPRDSAQRFALAEGSAARDAALAEGEVFLNATPISLWAQAKPVTANGNAAALIAKVMAPPSSAASPDFLRGGDASQPLAKTAFATPVVTTMPVTSPVLAPVSTTSPAKRDTSPEALKNVQRLYQDALDRMVRELDPQAHFVRYAPPAFIPFHKGVYLEVSLTTTLAAFAAGSQYRLAGLAFDRQISHLIRPALSYFSEDRGDFDGIDFSASVRLNDPAVEGGSAAVEFIVPLPVLRAYEQFDCTGQQLIDASFVLINGERVSLNLQNAEAASQ